MKAVKHYLPESVDEMLKSCNVWPFKWKLPTSAVYVVLFAFQYLPEILSPEIRVTIQMEATEQYFPVALFIMLYKVI